MASRIKNKAAAPVQISAEQLLLEAASHQLVKEVSCEVMRDSLALLSRTECTLSYVEIV
jgi:predicted dinucleotide-utilizing enzyme